MELKTQVLAAGTIVLGLLVASCGGNSKDPKQAQGAPGYKTLTVEPSEYVTERSYSATIRGRQDINIYPQVSGSLWQVKVNEGQAVKRGQVLFVVDQVPYQAALQQATANVSAAEAALSTSKLNYDARKRLFDEKIISEMELRTAENTLRNAEAALAQAKAAQVSARNNLSYTTVTSPADGVVGTLPYRQGTLVGPSMAQPLTMVSDNAEMYVYFSLDENRLLELSRKYGSLDAAVSTLGEVRLKLSDGSTYAHTGKVESISGVIDRTTGSASLRAKFPNPERMLHSGATGNVVLLHKHTGIFVIPQGATVRLQDKVLVYKVVEGAAVGSPVTVEAGANPTEYIVTSGLNQGDVIVAEGAGLIREGTKIQ